jgi:large subunit ribosomal protein L4
MAVTDILNIEGAKVGEIELKDEIFNCEVKEHLIHDVVKMQLARRRRGTAKTKGRTRSRRRRNLTTERDRAGPARFLTFSRDGWRRNHIRASARDYAIRAEEGQEKRPAIGPYGEESRHRT